MEELYAPRSDTHARRVYQPQDLAARITEVMGARRGKAAQDDIDLTPLC